MSARTCKSRRKEARIRRNAGLPRSSLRRPVAIVCATAAFLLAAVLIRPAAAQPSGRPLDVLEQVDIEQKPGAQVPRDVTFRDEHGERVALGDYLGEKPVILNLVYFECPMLCNLTMDGLVRSLSTLSLDPGRDFTVLTVSFDHREGPNLAHRKKKTVMTRYGRDGAEQGWHFLTGGKPSIRRLTDAVGFRYRWDQEKGRYAHAAGIVVLTPEGRVSRYLNGVEYAPRDVRLSLVEASEGEVGSATDQVLLLCYQYDPMTGKYGLAILGALRIGGALTVVCLAGMIVVLLRRERRGASAEQAPRRNTGDRLV